MKLIQGISAILLATLAAGCATDKEQVNPAKLVKFNETAKLEVSWKQNVGKMGINVLTPAVTAESVLAANSQGMIYSFEKNTGKQLWRVNSGFAISGAVGAGENIALVGGVKGEIAAYEVSSGKFLWKSKVSSEVQSAPKISEGIVVVRTGDGRIAGLNSQTGERLWLYERSTPALVARSNAGVTIRRGIVYAGFAAGKLAAISLHNGVIIWESSVSQPRGSTELERISDIISLPELNDSQVCGVAFQGRIACFDADQGGSLWTRDIASDKGLTMSRKYLFLTESSGEVLGLDKLSGSSYWKNDQLHLRQTTAPLAQDRYLAVADYEGYVHTLNRDDGSFIARMRTDGSAINSAPVELNEGFVVQTVNGGIFAMTLR
ncbi:MAG: outer membrane protein assembly factor BamB [Gallionellaceae bacterium]|jgi:outer membrane protein assembly factor BamB